jgi:hypothetical protein
MRAKENFVSLCISFVSLWEITSNCLVFEKDHNKDFKTIFALLKSATISEDDERRTNR